MKYIKLNKISKLFFIVILGFFFSACANSNQNISSDTQTSTNILQKSNTNFMTIIDREGKSITLKKEINRIISMAPSITETIISMGIADKLIAVDKYSSELEGIPQNLPIYDIMTPDIENIALLNPDIIFASGVSKAGGEDPFELSKNLGLVITYIPSSISIQGIKEDIRFIGDSLGISQKATDIIKNMEDEISNITSKIKDIHNFKKIYFEISPSPNIYTFGEQTFLNEIIKLLGVKNIFEDQNSWISVSEESIISKNPDIIFTNVNYIENPVDEILKRDGWDSIDAIKNKEVYKISSNESSRPNEHIIIVIKEMAKILYPEIFNYE